jgi:tetratricopeptide (TPR) repeat protein
MPEEIDPSSAGKKRRVIHWNPDADAAPDRRRWSWQRIVLWTVGGFIGLLLVAGVVIRVAKRVLGPDLFASRSESAANDPTANDPSAAFVTQSKAEFTYENVKKALVELRRMPQDHPKQREKLVLIEKAFIAGEPLVTDHEYAKAYAHFTALNKEIDDYTASVKAKQDAQQTYNAILAKIRDLEIARSIAPEALEEAMIDAGAGWKFLGEGSFIPAKQTLDRGMAELKKAEAALARNVEENLLKGQDALSKGQKENAIVAFKAALEKSPSNELAQQGLKRAENIDRVHALLLQGAALEKSTQYAAAADAYAKAFALDAFSATAQQGQARAARLDKETRFDAAYTAAQAAFKNREWDKAIAEGQNALKVYPQRTEVTAMVKSARENAHTDAVEKTLKKAFAYENQHEWENARKAYNDTLQLEPEHADAKEGYIRSGTMIRALLEYNKHLEIAEERTKKAEFQTAISEFNKAMAVKPAYLVNSDKVQQMHALLMAQNKPVDVTFESDGKTYVQISNFRMLGQFTSTTVKILPGDYEIVGRRKGYQDVLLLVQVRYGAPAPTVAVACRLTKDS